MVLSKNVVKNIALSLVTVAVLAACHSGKTARKAPTPAPTPTPTPTPTELSLKVADGYLKGAFVFLDVNKNSIFDDGEPSGETGVGGVVTLDTSGVENPDTYPIIALATVEKTIDEDTNAAVTKAFSMSTPAGNTVINPITTLIQTKITAAQAAGDVLNLPDAIIAVAAELGLSDATTEQMLGDYLVDKDSNEFNQKIHAIARSIVQLLPADAAGLAASLDGTNAVLKAITDAINAAIDAGGDPDAITIVVKDDGNVDVSLPEVADAKAFIADFRTWGAKIEAEINDPAASFGDKADAAEAVIDAQLDALLIKGNAALMIVEDALDTDTLNDLVLADFPGATGTVTTDLTQDDTMIVGVINLDLTYGSDSVKLSIDIDAKPITDSTKSSGELTFSGTLANTSAAVSLSDATLSITNVQVATDTQEESLDGAEVMFAATMTAQSLVSDTGLFSGAIKLNGKMRALANETDSEFVPTLASFDGSFGSGDEAFNAALSIVSTGDYTLGADGVLEETAENWADATATLTVDVDLADFSGASVDIMVERKSLDDGLVNATLTYGDSVVELATNTADETGMIKVTNDAGILVTLETKNVADGDVVGEVFLGIKQVGVITLVGSVHKIKYADGTFETLF